MRLFCYTDDMQKLTEIIGPLPVKVDVQPNIVERVDCGKYTREKVEYFVEEGERVCAYILIPKVINHKRPAIFCHHQHNGEFKLGKSEVVGLVGDSDQAYAKELAEQGFVTFAPDAIAFEERNWSEDGAAEYYELTTRLVKGQTLLAKVLHDVSVGIDYLSSRPEVDADNIGFIGHSYGGRMAFWAPAFDERIKVSVSNCGCIPYRDSFTHDTGIQAEFCVPAITNELDIDDLAKAISPSSLLISATTNDKWSRGAQEIYDAAKSSFNDGQFELKLYEGEHVFTQEMRNYAYNFLRTKLV